MFRRILQFQSYLFQFWTKYYVLRSILKGKYRAIKDQSMKTGLFAVLRSQKWKDQTAGLVFSSLGPVQLRSFSSLETGPSNTNCQKHHHFYMSMAYSKLCLSHSRVQPKKTAQKSGCNSCYVSQEIYLTSPRLKNLLCTNIKIQFGPSFSYLSRVQISHGICQYIIHVRATKAVSSGGARAGIG